MTRRPSVVSPVADILREMLDGLVTRPGRTILTALGVAMVTAATVAGVTIGRTNQGAVANAFAASASGYITVRAPDGADVALSLGDTARAATAPGLLALASGVRWSGLGISAHFDQSPTHGIDIWGIDGDISSAAGLEMTWGRGFDDGHLVRGDQVALVGSGAASQLGMAQPDGHTALLIEGRPFLILGEFDTAAGDHSLASMILIPRLALQAETDDVDVVYAVTDPLEVAQSAARLAIRLAPNGYQLLSVVYDPGDLSLGTAVVGEVRALTAGLLVIGSLVAMVVVGSLVTASVSERRREVAVRKALGATSTRITLQFVGESALVGLGGAAAGVLIGFGLAAVVANVRNWALIVQPGIEWTAIIQGLAASTVGALAPAIRAARLDPAEALSRP